MKPHPHSGKRRRRLPAVKTKHADEFRNEINVTPLVDVCLVLLIIFMVIAPMLARGKEVKLPMTLNHISETDEQQPVVVMDVTGQLYFDKDPIADLDLLKQRVEAAWKVLGNGERKVFLKADVKLDYGKVYPLIIAMHELGVPNIDLGTNKKK